MNKGLLKQILKVQQLYMNSKNKHKKILIGFTLSGGNID